MAYAVLAKSLQSEWQYLQRVVWDCGPSFADVEVALCDEFYPALFGQVDGQALDVSRELLTFPVWTAGLGIPNPCNTAMGNFKRSVKGTRELVGVL